MIAGHNRGRSRRITTNVLCRGSLEQEIPNRRQHTQLKSGCRMPVTHIGSCACWETMHRSKSQSSATSTCLTSQNGAFLLRPLSGRCHPCYLRPGCPMARQRSLRHQRLPFAGGKGMSANPPARRATYYHLSRPLVAQRVPPELENRWPMAAFDSVPRSPPGRTASLPLGHPAQ